MLETNTQVYGNTPEKFSHRPNGKIFTRYGLSANGVILGEPQHGNLVEDMVRNYPVKYIAGGSTQNSMRVAQYVFNAGSRGKAHFLGSVGDDKYAKLMEKKATEDGVDVTYVVEPKQPTGTCAVLVTQNGLNRSLVSFLGAAKLFTKDHLAPNWQLLERSKVIYCAGFPLTSSFEACHAMALHVNDNPEKKFCLNLSAPYLSVHFQEQLLKILPYVDVLFGNESEALAFARASNWQVRRIIKKFQAVHLTLMIRLIALIHS